VAVAGGHLEHGAVRGISRRVATATAAAVSVPATVSVPVVAAAETALVGVLVRGAGDQGTGG